MNRIDALIANWLWAKSMGGQVRAGALACLMAMIAWLTIGEASAQSPPPPGKGEPVRVSVSVLINNLYDIDTVKQTYNVDGYLLLGWTDPRLADTSGIESDSYSSYENAEVEEVLGREVWWPNVEFTNIVGGRSISNRRIVVTPSGKVIYIERFDATLTKAMDFRRFPFDEQIFEVSLESFSYDSRQVVFYTYERSETAVASDSWDFAPPEYSASETHYENIDQMLKLAGSSGSYSTYSGKLRGQRKTGYYIWQLFLPLFLIIASSWSVFWVPELSDRLTTAFTLLLTVVAYNFYVTDMLPQLPYNTLVEAMIVIGYIQICLAIALIIYAHMMTRRGTDHLAHRLDSILRWLMPVASVVAVVLICRAFLWN